MSELIDPSLILLNYTVDDSQFSLSFGALDHLSDLSTKKGLVMGLGIGAGVVLALASWCSISKKKTPVFILNQICLWLMVLRCTLYMVYLLGPLNYVSYIVTNIEDNYESAFNVSIVVSVVNVLLISAIECLFVFQVFVMFKALKRKACKWLLIGASILLALAVFVIYVVETTYNLKDDWAFFNGAPRTVRWRVNLPFILFCVSINCLSILLIVKLAVAIRTRRVLGLKQFNALHVLLIMTLQTCIIPSAMTIYNYTLTDGSPIYVNLSVIIVVCNLPFSSLWATSTNNSSVPSSCQNSVFSRVSSNNSEETLTFSFRGKANHKGENNSDDYEKGYNNGSVSDDDGATINRILKEIEMELKIQPTRSLSY